MCDVCIENYVKIMCKNLDTNIDPTVDFVKYASGNFHEENFDASKGIYLPKHSGFLNVLLDETINYPSVVKARIYFKSHKKEFPILLKNKYLTDICGTFPAFDEQWQSDKFDWIKAAGFLSSLHFGIIMSLRRDYSSEHRTTSISVIPPDSYPALDKFELLRKIGVPENKISEIVVDFNTIEEKFKSFTTKKEYPHFEKVKKTFSELKQEKFDYCKYIEICTAEPHNEDDIFIINNLESGHFDKFTNMFEEAGPRAVANYITFKVASQMGNEYYSEYVVERFFAPAIISAGFSVLWSKEVSEKRKKLLSYFKKSFNNIKHNFKKDCSEIISLFEIDDEKVIEFVEANLNQEKIENEYHDLEIDPNDFMKNFLYLRERGHTPSSKMLCKLGTQSGFYCKSVSLLNFLSCHYNRPMSYFFTTWDLKMWRDLIYECRFEENSEELSNLKERVKKQIKAHQLTEIGDDDYEHFWGKHYVAMIGAIQLAYKDFSDWMANNENEVTMEENVLKKFNLNCPKSFFISFVQNEYFAEDVILNHVILCLINSQDFCDTFNCKFDSPMAEKDKCVLS